MWGYPEGIRGLEGSVAEVSLRLWYNSCRLLGVVQNLNLRKYAMFEITYLDPLLTHRINLAPAPYRLASYALANYWSTGTAWWKCSPVSFLLRSITYGTGDAPLYDRLWDNE